MWAPGSGAWASQESCVVGGGGQVLKLWCDTTEHRVWKSTATSLSLCKLVWHPTGFRTKTHPRTRTRTLTPTCGCCLWLWPTWGWSSAWDAHIKMTVSGNYLSLQKTVTNWTSALRRRKGLGCQRTWENNQLHLLTSTPGPPAGREGNEEQKE